MPRELRGTLNKLRWTPSWNPRGLREAAEAAAKEAIGEQSELYLQETRVQGHQVEQGYRSHTGTPKLMSQNEMRTPCVRKFQAFLTSRGLISAPEPASDPIRVAGGLVSMAERDQSIYRHGQERVDNCEKAWEFLMKAMQG